MTKKLTINQSDQSKVNLFSLCSLNLFYAKQILPIPKVNLICIYNK